MKHKSVASTQQLANLVRAVDLNEIDTFAKVAETGSFTAAAQQLQIPRSTVSRRVERLERALGVRLFQRTTRKVSLTESGAAYFARVAPALSAVHDATRTAAEQHQRPRGIVRLTAPVDVATGFLAALIARFTDEHPEVQVQVDLTGRRVDLVEEGYDIALRAGTLSDSSLVARKLHVLERSAYAAPGYLQRFGCPQAPSELLEHRCVLFRATQGKEQWSLERDGRVTRVHVTGPVAGDEFLFVREATLEGAGVGLLPAFLAARDVEAGRLTRVLPGYADRSATLNLLYPSARYLPQRVVLLRDFLLRERDSLAGVRTSSIPELES